MVKARLLLVPLFFLTVCVCNVIAQKGSASATLPSPPLMLKTSAFSNGGYIPAKYGCDVPQAQGTPMISPPLEWANTPKGTISFALIMHDMGPNPQRIVDVMHLDVTHWLVYNVPATVTSLPEGIAPDAGVGDGGLQGANVHDVNGYQAPCPRGVGPHYYAFDLYALDAKLKLPAGAARTELLKAMDDHIIGKSSYTGLFNH
jgi:Raf kinase inhibitor-like YbhB/YbcL family protein